MSYNGSGTFNINSAGQPVVTGTVISSTAFNALTADLGTGLSTALTKDGQTVATARIPFAAGINSSLVTDATNTTTGSIITAGGVGIAKAVFVGTTLNVAGASTLAGITGSFNGTVGATTPAAGSFTTVNATSKVTFGVDDGAKVNVGGTAGFAGTGLSLYETSTGNNARLRLSQDAGAVVYNATYSTGTSMHAFQIGNAEVGRFSSTGLAVTGTISATGYLGVAGGGTTTAVAEFGGTMPAISSAAKEYHFLHADGPLLVLGKDATNYSYFQHDVAATTSKWVMRGNVNFATLSSAGLEVTGALKVTGTGEIQSYLRVGTSVPTTGLSAGDIALPNNRAVRGTSSAGSSSSQLVWVDANNVQHAGDGNANVGIAVPSIAAASFAANSINYAGAIAVDATNTTRLVFYAANGTRYYLTGTAF